MRKLSVIGIAIGLAFSAGAMAQSMSKDQYQSDKDGINASYKSAIAACGSFSGNAKDICKAEASGKQSIAKADLDARYKPSVDATYKVRVAQADADYSVAKERCDDKAGNKKDVCVKEAKANSVAAKADAKAWMKTANADNAASDKGNEARKDATSDKRDADYAVAREKCDAFASDAKDKCVNSAKVKFGKS